MTSYSRRRGYPTPDSDREPGNGGLDSETLARAIALDLDGVDAAWPLEQQKPTKILGLSSNQTGLIANDDNNIITFTALEAEAPTTTPGLITGVTQSLVTAPGGEGWYHVTASLAVQPSGGITNNALSRMILRLRDFSLPTSVVVERYDADAQNDGLSTAAIYLNTEAVVYMTEARQLSLYLFHQNVASTMNALVIGTYLSATKLTGVI